MSEPTAIEILRTTLRQVDECLAILRAAARPPAGSIVALLRLRASVAVRLGRFEARHETKSRRAHRPTPRHGGRRAAKETA